MSEILKSERAENVHIEKVFREKNPKLARFIPGFVFRYLRKIVHENDVNYILNTYGHLYDLDFIEANLNEFKITLETQGLENINKSRKYIFASNHPLGGFDGLILLKVLGEQMGKVKFLVNDILMNISNIRGLFIPINKHGRQVGDSIDQMDSAFRSGVQILTFPSGYVSRKFNGQIMDLPWKKSFIMKAIKYQRDIVPVHFSGNNSRFFYRLARIRRFLGIKANLEMFYLVDETWNHKGKHLVLKFGEPIPWQTFDKSKKPDEWAKWVKEKAYALDGITNIPF